MIFCFLYLQVKKQPKQVGKTLKFEKTQLRSDNDIKK